jgi:hypothetical protein
MGWIREFQQRPIPSPFAFIFCTILRLIQLLCFLPSHTALFFSTPGSTTPHLVSRTLSWTIQAPTTKKNMRVLPEGLFISGASFMLQTETS